jgi:hypothetical protein
MVIFTLAAAACGASEDLPAEDEPPAVSTEEPADSETDGIMFTANELAAVTELDIVYTDVAQGSGVGLEAEITRLAFASTGDMLARRIEPSLSASGRFGNLAFQENVVSWWEQFEVMGELEVSFINTGDDTAELDFANATLTIEDEQVSFYDLSQKYDEYFTFTTDFFEDPEVLPGGTVVGGLWFVLQETTLEALESLPSVSMTVPVYNEALADEFEDLLISAASTANAVAYP